MKFEVTSWGEGVEDLFHHGFVVLKAGDDGAGVDVVEGFAKGPVVLSIVDFEATVRRDAERC